MRKTAGASGSAAAAAASGGWAVMVANAGAAAKGSAIPADRKMGLQAGSPADRRAACRPEKELFC